MTATQVPRSHTAAELSPSRRSRLAAPLGAAALVVSAALALNVRDPHVQGSWGVCPTAALLGVDCPACGSLRAVHHLTNLDLVAAASSNLLLVLLVPVAVILWVRRVSGAWRGGEANRPLQVPTWVWASVLVLAAVFTLARNLPVGVWLHS